MEEAIPVPVDCSGAGGSGGSIYVTTKALEGAGTFSANGGTSGMQGIWPNGGGGGGRIALYYNTSTFTGLPNQKERLDKGATMVKTGRSSLLILRRIPCIRDIHTVPGE